MYQSRYHYENELLSVAIDSLTGELLELIYKPTGENFIKNSCFLLHQPFQLFTSLKGEKIRLFGGDTYSIARDAQLKPHITHDETENALRIQVSYDKLTDGEKSYKIPLCYQIELPKNAAELHWRLSLSNCQPELLIEDLRFPCLNGVYLGDTWEDDTLVYPYNAGIKIQNPVGFFSEKSPCIYWKWQEYRYVYSLGNIAAGPDEDGLYAMDFSYSGPLSMTWLDYYGEDLGIYFANHDSLPHNCSLRAETYGVGSPGMNFSFVHHPYCENGGSWNSPPLVTAVHRGDWHQGAEIYRSFRQNNVPPEKTKRPRWFEQSPGLVAHYDFKYQNGGIVHRYKDIPCLLDEAREMGLNHLLLAGWHHDGFDHGFPEYHADADLGTEEEFREAVSTVRQKGGHLSFYINSRIANTKYDPTGAFTAENVVLQQDGSPFVEAAGNRDLNFAVMCVHSPEWRNRLQSAVQYATERIGADGVYLDQLAMAPPCICHNPAHGHSWNDWNEGYRSFLKQINNKTSTDAPMSIVAEGVSDAYNADVSGFLVSTFSYYCTGAFPELYKYTFPEQILVDMLYPESNMAMRPVHIGQASTDIINKAFVTGSYFWVYDLVDDNTFHRDPKQLRYLKDIITLRTYWLETFGHGIFRDTDGLLEIPGALIKRFELPGGLLLAVAQKQAACGECSMEYSSQIAGAAVYTVKETAVQKRPLSFSAQEGKVTFSLPQDPISLIVFDNME